MHVVRPSVSAMCERFSIFLAFAGQKYLKMRWAYRSNTFSRRECSPVACKCSRHARIFRFYWPCESHARARQDSGLLPPARGVRVRLAPVIWAWLAEPSFARFDEAGRVSRHAINLVGMSADMVSKALTLAHRRWNENAQS
jgi:hypothetical protein